MFGNYRKIEKRILSVILVIAMTFGLLSGCGQAKPDTEDATAWESAGKEAVSAGRELYEASQETKDLLDNLVTALDKKDSKDAAAITDSLSGQLADTKEKTNAWLSLQTVLGDTLDEESAGLLKEREKTFTKELEASRKNAEELLEDIQTALKADDLEEAERKTNELKNLLTEEDVPQTYGTSLPNETEQQVSDEAVYKEEPLADNRSMEPVQETEEELLATKGDTGLSDAIKEKAEELETPLAIYNYVKNNIGYEYYYGSRKGASGTLDSLGGNDLDQASLLIAMLRYQGYEAEYVKGDILLTEEQALSLTGAGTFKQAADVLASAGTPVTRLMRGEEIVYLRVEHVWVRAYIPYTDYRGAGNTSGDKVWLDLDTGIKDYEAVTNIYDTLDEEGFSEQIQSITESGDTEQLETLLSKWEKQLESKDLSETYARKRIIRQEELSYLPLSLQYQVEKEKDTFAQVPDILKDSVTFELNGDVLTSIKASDVQGKDILLSFAPASTSDENIYKSYDSIFDIPAYAVYMTPVLLVDGEEVARGEEYLESTLGTKSSFTIHISSGGKSTTITNDVTTGSMYAVTLDSQNITASELQGIYDEVATLKDSVTEKNVYSEAYLGKLLNLAGKLYYAQVDIADTIAADLYDVAVTRSLSEGITGYEVETTGLYGMVTGIAEGSLYIDVDNDSHSVLSLDEGSDAAREYFLSTGMISSLYESTVWEEITGEESVSTISILAKASEENIDILLLSKENLSEEIEKLNTDETTRQSVINAVNNGMLVTVPSQEVSIGDWHGTGYIVTNPATGVGEYMISGGLNGGSVATDVTLAYAIDIIFCIVDLSESILMIVEAAKALGAAIVLSSYVLGALGLVVGFVFAALALYSLIHTIYLMCKYVTGDAEAGRELVTDAWINVIISVATVMGRRFISNAVKESMKNRLVRKYGTDFVEKMLKEFDDVSDLSKCIKQLEKQNLSVGIILETAEKYGREGLEWLIAKSKLGLADNFIRKLLQFDDLSSLTDDFIKKLLQVDELGLLTDDVIKAIKNSNGHADKIIELIIKYGKDASTAIGTYGDEAAELIETYGEKAVEYFSKGKEPDQVRKLVVGLTDAKTYEELVSTKTTVCGNYEPSLPPSQILKQELYSAGVAGPPYKFAAHHIVPIKDPKAEKAREILATYGIEWNSAANGVFLPMETNKYTGDTALHIGGHSNDYIKQVTRRLEEADEAGGEKSVITELNNIRKDLLDGKLQVNGG